MKGDQSRKLSGLGFLSTLACLEADKGSGNFSFQYKRSAGRNLWMNSLLVLHFICFVIFRLSYHKMLLK